MFKPKRESHFIRTLRQLAFTRFLLQQRERELAHSYNIRPTVELQYDTGVWRDPDTGNIERRNPDAGDTNWSPPDAGDTDWRTQDAGDTEWRSPGPIDDSDNWR